MIAVHAGEDKVANNVYTTRMSSASSQIGGGFTEGELSFASFWVRRKMELTRAVYGTLIVLNAIVWLYSAWGVLDAFAISYPRESRITAEIANNQLTLDALEISRPQNVQVGNPLVFEGTNGRYDMMVDMENPNDQWWAEFNYRFNLSGQLTPFQNGFLMPLGKSTLTQLGFKPTARGGTSAQLEVDNIRWHRVDPSQVGARYKDFELNHFNVSFESVKYQGGLTLGSQQIGRTSFDVVNRGSYGYWSLGLVVRLYRADTVVGVNRITLTNLVPGETRHVDLDWFDRLPPNVSKTEIIPVVNFLDKNTYLPTTRF